MGMLVKEHKGVKIYLNESGMFYCNVVNNTDDFRNKTFESEKLKSIEKAINDHGGIKMINNDYYYDIDVHLLKITKLTPVKHVGDLIFFDDGRNNMHNKRLYPASIENSEEFKQINNCFNHIKNIGDEIRELNDSKYELMITIQSCLKKFIKVDVKL